MSSIKEIDKVSLKKLGQFLDGDSTFAVIRSDEMVELKSAVRNTLQLGYIQYQSRWTGAAGIIEEESLLIPGIKQEDALKLGERFGQESIIYKDEESCREIWAIESEEHQAGDIARICRSDIEDIFAKGTRETVTNGSFELYEVIAPRPSYFQDAYSMRLVFVVETM